MSISCGHCKGRHETVREVRQCAMNAGVPAGAIAEQNGLVQQRPGWSLSPFPKGTPEEPVRETRSQEVIDARERMFGANHGAHGGPIEKPAKVKQRAAEGMYRKAGTIYKVQKAVHGSGENYAKRLVQVFANDPKTGKPKFKFEYAPGFVFELRKEHMLTIEQAKEFGALYGTCCVCGRTLTKEESIAAGIGPICAEKF